MMLRQITTYHQGVAATSRRTAVPARVASRPWQGALALAGAVILALALLLATFLVSPVLARADEVLGDAAEQEKIAEPIVASFVVRDNDSDAWLSVADYAQGQDIPYDVIGAMPSDLDRRATMAYWMVVERDAGLTFNEDSPVVTLVHADGTTEDITGLLTVRVEGVSLVAGSSDILEAIPNLVASDRLALTFTMHFNEYTVLGFSRGNSTYAHIEYASTLRRVSSDITAQTALILDGTGRPAPVAGSVIRMAYARGGLFLHAADDDVVTPTATDDVRSPGLTRSPEVQATVYSYQLNLCAVAQGTGARLGGAQFALCDDTDGTELWYVKDGSWSVNRADATVVTTDDAGYASFRAVDSSAYRLVELSAPTGYQLVGDVDVVISADVNDTDTRTLTVSSLVAQADAADANDGMVTVTIEHAAAASNPRDAGTTGDGDDDGGTVNGSGRGLLSPLAKTGDLVLPFGLAVLLSVLALLGGLVLRQEGGRVNTRRSSSYGGWDGPEEGNGHGC